MRGRLIGIVMLCLAMVSAQPLASGKKKKKDRAARLRSLQTIYVEGYGKVASGVRRDLSQKTCLRSTPDQSEADAILDVEEGGPMPCEPGLYPALCTSVTAQLIDTRDNKTLWMVTDDSLPLADVFHQSHGRSDWVLWNLKLACCKGRRIPAQSKVSNP